MTVVDVDQLSYGIWEGYNIPAEGSHVIVKKVMYRNAFFLKKIYSFFFILTLLKDVLPLFYILVKISCH